MRTTVLIVAILVGGAHAAEAQQPVSSLADLWMRIRSGDAISVREGSGQETAGIFAKVSDSAVSLVVDGQPRDIPSVDVREIARDGDSVWNGFWIGVGIGAAIGAGATANCDGCAHPAAAAVTGGVVYGGLGALIDYLRKGRTVVFRAGSTTVRLRPAVAIGRAGVSASILFH